MHLTRARVLAATVAAATATLSLTACGGDSDSKDMTVAYQTGTLYAAPMYIRGSGCLDHALPDANIDWKVLNNGAAIRTGMLSDDIQVGTVGTGAYMVGWAQGVRWKYLTGHVDVEAGLLVTDPKITDLESLRAKGGKISVVSLDSPLTIMMQMAAKEQLGDSQALSEQFVALDHPSSLQALTTGQIAGYTATPPFLEQAEARGARNILSIRDLFPDGLTAGGPVALDDWVSSHKDAAAAYKKCTKEAVEAIAADPGKAATVVAKGWGDGAPSESDLAAQLDQLNWDSELNGALRLGETSKVLGQIDKAPTTMEEIEFTLK